MIHLENGFTMPDRPTPSDPRKEAADDMRAAVQILNDAYQTARKYDLSVSLHWNDGWGGKGVKNGCWTVEIHQKL